MSHESQYETGNNSVSVLDSHICQAVAKYLGHKYLLRCMGIITYYKELLDVYFWCRYSTKEKKIPWH